MENNRLFNYKSLSERYLERISTIRETIYHDFDYHSGYFSGHKFFSIVDYISRSLSNDFEVDYFFVKSILSQWRTQIGSNVSLVGPLQSQFNVILELVDRWKDNVKYRAPAVDFYGLDRSNRHRNKVYFQVVESISNSIANFKLIKDVGEFGIIGDTMVSGNRIARVHLQVITRYGYHLRGNILLPPKNENASLIVLSIDDILGSRLCASLQLGIVNEIRFLAICNGGLTKELDEFVDLVNICTKYIEGFYSIE